MPSASDSESKLKSLAVLLSLRLSAHDTQFHFLFLPVYNDKKALYSIYMPHLPPSHSEALPLLASGPVCSVLVSVQPLSAPLGFHCTTPEPQALLQLQRGATGYKQFGSMEKYFYSVIIHVFINNTNIRKSTGLLNALTPGLKLMCSF